jgi:hypothetical protein
MNATLLHSAGDPPETPLLVMPSTKETWVEVGPGRQWPRASSSMKTALLIHRSLLTNLCGQQEGEHPPQECEHPPQEYRLRDCEVHRQGQTVWAGEGGSVEVVGGGSCSCVDYPKGQRSVNAVGAWCNFRKTQCAWLWATDATPEGTVKTLILRQIIRLNVLALNY